MPEPPGQDAALALTRQAQACFDADRPAAGMRMLRRAVELAPGAAAAWHNLAMALQQEGDFPGAQTALSRALKLRPGDPGLRRAMILLGSRASLVERLLAEGVTLTAEDRIAEAEHRFATALRHAPRSVVARGNLATLLLRRGRAAEAAAMFETALAGAGRSVDTDRVRCDSALAHLLLGDYQRGWPAFEARWLLPDYRDALATVDAPRWTGAEDIAGKRLLLLAEQGFGDTLQFIRYATLAAARGAIVEVLAPSPLVRLLRRVPGVAAVHPSGTRHKRPDFACPMLSLPLAFGTTLASVPAHVPYLAADPDAAAAWRARLSALPGRRIGLVWAGGRHIGAPAAEAMDRRRSLPLALLAPLAAVGGASFVSLQKAPSTALPPWLHDWTAELTDFADTAALVAGLDLVISVDTAVAHLAGGMGRPIWLLNRFDSCWRWLQAREDSPWYPTLRQFRQTVAEDWAEVVARVAAALPDQDMPDAPTDTGHASQTE